MDTRIPTTTTEAQALIFMVQYYRDMWPGRFAYISPSDRGGW